MQHISKSIPFYPIVIEGFLPYIFVSWIYQKILSIYQIQIWQAYDTNKMPSDQHLNEDINAELDSEIRKNLFLVPVSIKGGSIHLHQRLDILIEGWWISPTPVPPILTNTIRFLQIFEYGQEIWRIWI